jgi:hypothetical protein
MNKATRFLLSTFKAIDIDVLAEALDAADTPSDQNWEEGSTTWRFDDGSALLIRDLDIELLSDEDEHVA